MVPVASGKMKGMRRRPLKGLIAWVGAGVPILLICALGSGLLGGVIGGYLSYSEGLPKIPDLKRYRPKTVSTFYAEDGTVIGIFYHEKRFPIALDSLPPHVVNAFLAAEDARFFSHTGVDLIGIARASIQNIISRSYSQGASTITQQVTRIFILSKEKRLARKIREMIVAFRLEKTLSKKEILQLYLNEIYLGKGAYGVEAAARNYFGKSAQDLSISEAAMIAGLVPNPSKYAPHLDLNAAMTKRAFVLDAMQKNNFITEDQYRKAMADSPVFREKLPNAYQRAPYFAEAVRQYIVERYGEERLYNEGLTVWTTCDLALQKCASRALVNGVHAWETRHKRPVGLVRRLKSSETRAMLAGPAQKSFEVGDVVEAVVLENNASSKRKGKNEEPQLPEYSLALRGGAQFSILLESNIRYEANDLLHFRITKIDGSRLSLEPVTLPPAQGAVVCIENATGYVRAMVGGTKFERSRFNRALQARRQPGSAFKPFVYTAALEWGHYGPQTVIVDEPIAVEVKPSEEEWIPANSDGGFRGRINIRQALAHSRNTAAVKVIMDVGIDATISTAKSLGIRSPLGKNLSLALGAAEVTPLELTGAYTVFPNMGMKIEPVLVKKVVDRFGNILEDNTMEPLDIAEITAQATATPPDPQLLGAQNTAATWESSSRLPGQDSDREVTPPATGRGNPVEIESVLSGSFPSKAVTSRAPAKRVLSPQSAYLMTGMLREVCTSGTAAEVSQLGRRDLAGKTGTTDDCTDAWFVGFNPRYTTGVWVGYDTKISLGPKEYGSVAALPVWMEFMKDALGTSPSEGYPVPQGIVFWGLNMPIESAGLDDLINGAPDVPTDSDPKRICPVDEGAAPAPRQVDPFADYQFQSPFQADPMNGFPMPVAYGSGSYPGTVRILSPKGKTLRFAYASVDEKGHKTLRGSPYAVYGQPPFGQEMAEQPTMEGWGPNGSETETPSHDMEPQLRENAPVQPRMPGSNPYWYGNGWNY